MKSLIRTFVALCIGSFCSITPVLAINETFSNTIAVDALLEKAIFNDSVEEIQQAVEAGAHIDYANGKPPILLAVLLKKPNAIETLINLGANLKISYEGNELVHYALKLEDFKSALLLVKAGAPISKPKEMNQKGVIYLVIEGLGNTHSNATALELIQAMIDTGYPINSVDWRMNGWYAVLGGCRSLDALKILMDSGMDVNQKIHIPHLGVKKMAYSTPLFRAIEYSNESAIRILLDSGADINTKITLLDNGVLYTPLSYALMARPSLVPVLLEYGASL